MINKYRKKPVVIDAVQYTGDNANEVMQFLGVPVFGNGHVTEIIIETLEGDMKVSKGDYVIKGIKEEFYPCKPDIFNNSYEQVN